MNANPALTMVTIRRSSHVADRHGIHVVFAVVVDPADPLDHDEVAIHQAAEPVVQVLVLGEPAMAAEIEPVAGVMDRATQAADIAIALEDRDR